MNMLNFYIDRMVHEGAVQMNFPEHDIEIWYFPNLNHAYIEHNNDTYWFECDGPYSALDEFLMRENWIVKKSVNV